MASNEEMYYNFHESLNLTQEQFMNYLLSQTPEIKAKQYIFTYIPPPLIILGTIGNLFCCFILSKCNLHREPTGFYMAALCLVNSIILIMGCGLHWISFVTDIPYISNLRDWTCRVWNCFFSILLYSSPWLIVAMMLERYVYLYHPKKRDTMCCLFAAKVGTIIISVALLCVAVHALWTYNLQEVIPGGNVECFVDPNLHFFHTKVWPWISAVVYLYLPIVIILVLQMFIGMALLPSDCHPSRVAQSGTHNSQLTKACLVLSIIYVLLTLPTIVLNLLQYCKPSLSIFIEAKAKLILVGYINQTLACLDHSVTFVVCYIFLPMLRQETKSLFCSVSEKCCRRPPQVYQLTSIECTTEEVAQENGETKSSTMV